MTDLDSLTFRFAPARLADHPGVREFVGTLGVGELIEDTLYSPGGRNINWAGETTGGPPIFVKSLPPTPIIAANALRRTLAYESAAEGLDPDGPLRSPRFLGYDLDAGLLAYELLPKPHSLNSVAALGDLDAARSREIGAAVAALHHLPVAHVTTIDDAPLVSPPVDWLRAVPVEAVGTYTMAQLAGWRMLQADPDLFPALTALRAEEAAAPKKPIHGDLRMDQFLISDDRIWLCDWESFRLGDPARDVGAFLGELLFQSIHLELNRHDDSPDGAETTLDHAEVMRRSRIGLDQTIGLAGAMWEGYLAYATPDPGLPRRTLGFAGWHMFDRLLTWAEDSSQLNPAAKAMAGIGRKLLLNPDGAAPLFRVTLDGGAR